MISRIVSLLKFALECFLSPFVKGEFVTVEFTSKDNNFAELFGKSFKAKDIREVLLVKTKSTDYFERVLMCVPPKFEGGRLYKGFSENGKPFFRFIFDGVHYPVRVRRIQNEEEESSQRVKSNACA